MNKILINSSVVIEKITHAVNGRFLLSDDDTFYTEMVNIISDDIADKAVMRIKRALPNAVNWRTILIAVLSSYQEFKKAMRWAAAVKDELLEPEIGDIYLIAIIEDENPSLGQCTNLEASDRICRKYVLRPQETIDELIDRTFIASVLSASTNGNISDPLYLALDKTHKDFPWLGDNEQNNWRQALLSGKSGAELIDILFKS